MKKKVTLLLFIFLNMCSNLSIAERLKWNFSVYRNGKKVGNHTFSKKYKNKKKSKENYTIISKASFTIPIFLFVKYKYNHQTKEIWSKDCMIKINSKTTRNKNITTVKGSQKNNFFVYKVNNKNNTISSNCIQAFAYWDINILKKAKSFFNPDNGYYRKYKFKKIKSTTNYRVKRRNIKAEQYTLSNKKNNITLWYSLKNFEWIGLKAKLKDGSNLVYQLN